MSAEPENVVPRDEFERHRRAKRGALSDFRDEDGDPVEAAEFARRKTKLPDLRRLVKHGESNALYDFELAGGERIPIGSAGDLLNPRKVDAALADAGVAIPYYTPKRWRPVAAALLAVAEVEDTGSPEAEETCGWIASLAGQVGTRELRVSEPEQLCDLLEDPDVEPCFRGDDRRLYLRIDRLVRHVTHHVGQRTTRRDVSARLGRLGFEKEQLSARVGSRVLKARYWASPSGFDPEEEA